MQAKIDFAVGGQAVIEGVMMRSPHYYTVSVRDPQGKLKVKQAAFQSWTERYSFLNIPLLRGLVHLFESMRIGYGALNFSNAVFIGEDEEEARGPVARVLWMIFTVFYTLFMLGVTLFLLKFLPLWVAEQAAEFWPVVKANYLLFNSIDGLTKISVFLLYISSIALLKDIRRVFQYHGAEHKSIWTYEKGLPLTVEHARKQTRFHPRCGTSFIFIVILMSVFVYTLIPPVDGFWGMLGQRVAVIPLVAGVSYETLKLSARFQDKKWVQVFVAPGLFLQRLTTREPDDEQLEVALHSLKASLEVEGHTVPVI
ncbi:DUF1385 domain-containing protein [Candidatus Peregrinibacteria bacterium]|nr:MAG: DUF1385 domain-containing protein [Candidatus Peregrinibacteria bacterium]